MEAETEACDWWMAGGELRQLTLWLTGWCWQLLFWAFTSITPAIDLWNSATTSQTADSLHTHASALNHLFFCVFLCTVQMYIWKICIFAWSRFHLKSPLKYIQYIHVCIYISLNLDVCTFFSVTWKWLFITCLPCASPHRSVQCANTYCDRLRVCCAVFTTTWMSAFPKIRWEEEWECRSLRSAWKKSNKKRKLKFNFGNVQGVKWTIDKSLVCLDWPLGDALWSPRPSLVLTCSGISQTQPVWVSAGGFNILQLLFSSVACGHESVSRPRPEPQLLFF